MKIARQITSVALAVSLVVGVAACGSEAEQAADAKAREVDGGKLLYTYFKSFGDNKDVPGFQEDVFVDGRMLYQCTVGGKYPLYYGWFTKKDTFFLGQPINDMQPTTLYVMFIDYGNTVRGHWAVKNAGILGEVKRQGCSPP